MQKSKEAFLAINQYSDLSEFLSLSTQNLLYFFFKKRIDNNYTTFDILTKGKLRVIASPNYRLKNFQKKLCKILETIYTPKKCVNAFTANRSIVSNAIPHLHARFILKIDLKDFFPSIHFGRVKNLFGAKPFNFPDHITTLLAKICCYNGSLPQGSPLSPLISNMICYRMDNQFLKMCSNYHCFYTRYADDITISSRKNVFPLATRDTDGSINISDEIISLVSNNYFQINNIKTRLYMENSSKFVTGIKVNTKLNTTRKRYREVRAMLHAIEKYGPEKALTEYNKKHTKRNSICTAINFFNVISGKIAFLSMIRGNDDVLVAKLKIKLYQLQEIFLSKGLNFYRKIKVERLQDTILNDKPLIICEGKTDRIILSKALSLLQKKNKFFNLNIHFYIHNDYNAGKGNLKNFINGFSKIHSGIIFSKPVIFIFDRDVDGRETCILKKNNNEIPRYHGNNMWSFLLPIPSFRESEFDYSISIEHYFSDLLIFAKDEAGRRLYCFDEFEKIDGVLCLKSNNSIKLDTKDKKIKKYSIIDANVVDNENKNIARSKFDFAKDIILNNKIDDVTLREFEEIFKKIEWIIKQASL